MHLSAQAGLIPRGRLGVYRGRPRGHHQPDALASGNVDVVLFVDLEMLGLGSREPIMDGIKLDICPAARLRRIGGTHVESRAFAYGARETMHCIYGWSLIHNIVPPIHLGDVQAHRSIP